MANLIQNNRDLADIQKAGATLTDRHRDIEARWAQFVEATRAPAAERLAEAIIDGADLDVLDRLHRDAAVEGDLTPGAMDAARTRARVILNRSIREETTKTGRAAWGKFSTEFDEAAARLTDNLAIIDPFTDAEAIVGLPQKAQKAWIQGREDSTRLDQLLGLLAASARLAGADVKSKSDIMGLVIDRNRAHRRKVWEAWDGENRWVAILNTGARLRAVTLEEHDPFTEPAPILYVMGRPGNFFDPSDYEDSTNALHIAALDAARNPMITNRAAAALAALRGETVDA